MGRCEGTFGDEEQDGGNGEEEGYVIEGVVGEEGWEVEAGHPVYGSAEVEGVYQVALYAGYVGGGEVWCGKLVYVLTVMGMKV